MGGACCAAAGSATGLQRWLSARRAGLLPLIEDGRLKIETAASRDAATLRRLHEADAGATDSTMDRTSGETSGETADEIDGRTRDAVDASDGAPRHPERSGTCGGTPAGGGTGRRPGASAGGNASGATRRGYRRIARRGSGSKAAAPGRRRVQEYSGAARGTRESIPFDNGIFCGFADGGLQLLP